MSYQARFRLSDGRIVVVGEGGMIGRALTAQLRLEAPDVSEAHALVSRREGGLRLLALRGRIRVDGIVVTDIELRPGQHVELGSQHLTVESVALDDSGQPDLPPTVGSGAARVQVDLEEGLVRIRQGDGPTLLLGGNLAELVRLLAEAREPVHWSTLARYFWPEREQPRWRQRFDAMLKDLRARLREHRIRADLLWAWDGRHRLNLVEGDETNRSPSGSEGP